MFYCGNDNSVSRPNIVHQEITVRMKGLASYRRRDDKCSAVDLCAGGCCDQGSHVADGATDFIEQIGSLFEQMVFSPGFGP